MLAKKNATAQAPRSLAGARGSDIQAGRGQNAQAGRGQDAQAGRGQDAQAGRGTTATVASGTTKSDATKLVAEAEAACKIGDMKTAKAEAEAAIAILK